MILLYIINLFKTRTKWIWILNEISNEFCINNFFTLSHFAMLFLSFHKSQPSWIEFKFFAHFLRYFFLDKVRATVNACHRCLRFDAAASAQIWFTFLYSIHHVTAQARFACMQVFVNFLICSTLSVNFVLCVNNQKTFVYSWREILTNWK